MGLGSLWVSRPARNRWQQVPIIKPKEGNWGIVSETTKNLDTETKVET